MDNKSKATLILLRRDVEDIFNIIADRDEAFRDKEDFNLFIKATKDVMNKFNSIIKKQIKKEIQNG